MTSQNPLFSYDSLRSVIGYLDPFVRLRISTHCPSLQNVTSIVPMKIKNLRVTRSDFKINSITYKIGIIRKYINRRNPVIVERQNAQGGYQFDTDQYGIRRDQRMVMPDVSVIENAESELENTLRQKGRAAIRGNNLQRFDRDIDTIERRLEVYRAMLDIANVPFSIYVQLMMIPDDGPRKVQYLMYNKTLQEVKDHFMIKLFGTYTPIHVENMNVDGGYLLPPLDLGSIVGLDRGFTLSPEYSLKSPYFPLETSKLKVSNLSINWDIPGTLNAIRPVLEGSPLKMIKIERLGRIPDDPIIQSAELLNIIRQSQLGVLMMLSNQRVHLEKCTFTEENVNNLVNHWKSTKERVGKHYSIRLEEDDVKKFLRIFRGLPGARNRKLKETRFIEFPECIVLPIGDHSEVMVYCGDPQYDYCDTQWIVNIKIQDKGFADNLFVD